MSIVTDQTDQSR